MVTRQYLLASSFKTLESLAHNLVHHLLVRIPTSSAVPYTPENASSSAQDSGSATSMTYSKKKDVAISVQIRKPAAIVVAKCPSIEMRRCLRDYDEDLQVRPEETGKVGEMGGSKKEIPEPQARPLIPAMRSSLPETCAPECGHDHPAPSGASRELAVSSGSSRPNVVAYIAIGTNLGDRIANIHAALAQLPRVGELLGASREIEQTSREEAPEDEEDGDEGFVRVTRTSRLYESRPMYVLDQGEFINGVIEVSPCFTTRSLYMDKMD